MKLILPFVLSFILASCGSLSIDRFLPAKPKWPEAVKELTEPCPNLRTIEGDKVAITELLKAVVDNYALYYDCSLKNEGWNKWYLEQKRIYEMGGKK